MAKEDKDTISFSVTLPVEAVEMLENLIPIGLYGKKRATIASQLILDQLKAMRGRGDI
jgi:hypothetical protein